jgi:hypothetical protein
MPVPRAANLAMMASAPWTASLPFDELAGTLDLDRLEVSHVARSVVDHPAAGRLALAGLLEDGSLGAPGLEEGKRCEGIDAAHGPARHLEPQLPQAAPRAAPGHGLGVGPEWSVGQRPLEVVCGGPRLRCA